MPISRVKVICSLKNNAPIITRTHASIILAVSEPVLIFQPTRYMNIYPISRPTIEIPKITEYILSFESSAARAFGDTVRQNAEKDNTAAVIYVIVSDKKELASGGVSFADIL